MAEITICPRFLFNYQESTPSEIEKNIIAPLRDLFENVQKHSMEIIISKHLMDKFIYSYPWVKSTDNQWRGYINDWYYLVLDPILKYATLKSHSCNIEEEICSIINQDINNLFISFLDNLSSTKICSEFYEDGIFTNGICDEIKNCKEFQLIDNSNNTHYVKYPWLPLYDSRLPYSGEFPFIPQKNWSISSKPIKGKQNGFMDKDNREWCRDTLHKDHWDVQDSLTKKGTTYTNVNDEGKILSRK